MPIFGTVAGGPSGGRVRRRPTRDFLIDVADAAATRQPVRVAVDTDRQRIFRRSDIAAEVGATVFAVVIAIVGWAADPDAVGFGFIGAGGLVLVSGLLRLRTRRRLTPEEWTALEASRRELGGRARLHANAFAQQVRHPHLVIAGGAVAMTYGIAAMTLA